jgi:hypothetical protein
MDASVLVEAAFGLYAVSKALDTVRGELVLRRMTREHRDEMDAIRVEAAAHWIERETSRPEMPVGGCNTPTRGE